MQNLSDKELDELMKKASESQSYSYDADSWTALSDKLDKTPKRGFAGGQTTLLVVIAGLVLMSAFYFTVSDKSSVSSHTEASLVVKKKHEVNTAETKTAEEKTVVRSESDTHSDKALAPTKNQENNANVQQANIRAQAGMIDTNGNVKTREVENIATFPGEEQRASPLSTKQASVMETTSVPVIAAVQGSLATQELNTHSKNTPSDEVFAHTKNQTSNANVKQSNTHELTGILAADRSIGTPEKENSEFSLQEEKRASSESTKHVRANSLVEEAIIDSAVAEKKEMVEVKSGLNTKDSVEEKKNEATRTSHFAIKLSVSPDFSSENFSKADAMGWNYGAAVEYQINKAFAVSAGLLNTRKYYTAEDVTYGRYTAEFAEGDCRMWDIPVNVHYYIPSKQSLQLIGSLGFSSYIMKQENYVYYPDETDKDRKYYSEINNENSEWFKVLNVSIAAQLRVSPVLYLQLEPFIKAPLTGLGEGNISLSSFGTFFNVKYQLFTKNTRNNALKK